MLELLSQFPSVGLSWSSGPDILLLCGNAVLTGICLVGIYLLSHPCCLWSARRSPSPAMPIAVGGAWESPVLEGHGAELEALWGFSCYSINPLAKVGP